MLRECITHFKHGYVCVCFAIRVALYMLNLCFPHVGVANVCVRSIIIYISFSVSRRSKGFFGAGRQIGLRMREESGTCVRGLLQPAGKRR